MSDKTPLVWRQWVAIGLLFFCGLSVLIALISPSWKGSDTSIHLASGKKHRSMAQTVLAGDRLVQVTLAGMISENEEDPVFVNSVSGPSVLRQLNDLALDTTVKGVLLRINSPGGTVGMSQELYRAVLRLRKEKPVVVIMGDLAASGGYYTASAANKIVANPGTLTASIGVILHSMNMENLLTQKLGVKPLTIKSGRFKDILSPYRSATPEDLALLQNIIDKSYAQFIGDVLVGRTMEMKDPAEKEKLSTKIRSVADGRVVLGTDAVTYGLIDEVGDSKSALALLQKISAKAFDISDPESLELDDAYGKTSIWDEILQSNLSGLKRQLSPELGLSKADLLPKSLRFTNQPLWLMESLEN